MQLRRNGSFAAGLGLSVALAVLVLSSPGTRAAGARLAVAGPNSAEFAAVSKGCLANLYKTPFDAFRHVITCNQAWTEYNTGTCQQISPGNYRVPAQPMHGTISTKVIGGLHLGNGDCPDNTYTFKFSYYNWTDDHEGRCGQNCTDPFTVEWYTPDGEFDYPFPMVADLAPRITGDTELWWFDGAPSPDQDVYPIELRLTAQPSGYTYQWLVTTSPPDVALVNPAANPVRVRSTDYSPADGPLNNTEIRVTGEVGGPSNPFRLTVRTPYRMVNFRNHDQPYPGHVTQGYYSQIHYHIFDQFGDDLPDQIPWSEQFNGAWNHNGTVGWTRGAEVGGTIDPANAVDHISLFAAPGSGVVPLPRPPAPGSDLLTCASPGQTATDNWQGEWRVGNATAGIGMRVETLTWQRYVNHARHCNIQSPAP